MSPRFQHLPLDFSNTHEWGPLTPPIGFLIKKTYVPQTPSPIVTYQFM